MKIKFEIKKRHFMISSLFLISILATVFVMGAINHDWPWLPLSQISGNGGVSSVDENNNGIIDDADKVNGLAASDILAQTFQGDSVDCQIIMDGALRYETFCATVKGNEVVRCASGNGWVDFENINTCSDEAFLQPSTGWVKCWVQNDASNRRHAWCTNGNEIIQTRGQDWAGLNWKHISLSSWG